MKKTCDFECVKTGFNAVSFLPVLLSCVRGVFNSPVATPAHGLLGFRPSFRLQFISENANLLALYVYSTTHGRISLNC